MSVWALLGVTIPVCPKCGGAALWAGHVNEDWRKPQKVICQPCEWEGWGVRAVPFPESVTLPGGQSGF